VSFLRYVTYIQKSNQVYQQWKHIGPERWTVGIHSSPRIKIDQTQIKIFDIFSCKTPTTFLPSKNNFALKFVIQIKICIVSRVDQVGDVLMTNTNKNNYYLFEHELRLNVKVAVI
jgi:hypothetical protein